MHESVLLQESIDSLGIRRDGMYVDATLGMAGHTLEILKRGGRVIGIEADSDMLAKAQKRLSVYCENNACPTFKLLSGNFSDIQSLLEREKIKSIDGAIFDLGISSVQIDEFKRGFSFSELNSKLDMRLSTDSQQVMASDLLNGLNVGQLKELFSSVTRKDEAQRLARAVIEYRHRGPIETVEQMLEIVEGARIESGRIHAATKPMLALRIAVNTEIENIKEGVSGAIDMVSPGGRIAAISFHSGEDKVVKEIFKNAEVRGLGARVGKKPISPQEREVERNRRARSGKLRVFEKYEKSKRS